MTALEEYFLKPRAERIILIEITRSDGKKYYLSDTAYITEDTDTPANLPFSPVISSGGIPRIKRTLTDPLEGSVSTSYGELVLSDDEASYRTVADARGIETLDIYRGNLITLKLAGPRALFNYSEALTLFTGRVGRIGQNHAGEVIVEMVDPVDKIRTAIIPMNTYTNGGYKPLLFGRCYNVTPVLLDRATLVYQVHDGAINAVLQVYDNGVPVAYTPDAANGQFTLTSAPAGTVTCDIEGDKPSTWHSTTKQIVGRLLDLCGLTTGVLPRSMMSMPSGVIGYFMKEPEDLHAVITKLVRGAGCWWTTSRTGVFTVRALPYPNQGALDFDGTDDRVVITNPTALDIATFSLEVWVNPDIASDNGGIFEKTVGGAVNTKVNLFQSGTDFNFRIKPAGATVTITAPVTAGALNHLVATYDGTNMRLYKNGVLAAGPTACGAASSGAGDAYIGSLAPGAGYEFNGKIDGVRFYAGAISDAEVANHYVGIYSDESTLVGKWGFEEGSGLVAYDTSGNANDGVLTNGPTHIAPLFLEQASFDETTQLEAAAYRTEDRVIREVKTKYRPNWTKQSQFAASAATAQVEFAQTDGRFITVTGSGDESESISWNLDTYFTESADATIVADRVLDLYEVRRRIFTWAIPVGSDRLEPGSLASVTEPIAANTFVLSVEDVFDGLYPMLGVESIA